MQRNRPPNAAYARRGALWEAYANITDPERSLGYSSRRARRSSSIPPSMLPRLTRRLRETRPKPRRNIRAWRTQSAKPLPTGRGTSGHSLQNAETYAASLSGGPICPDWSSHASRVHHACSSPHSGHLTRESTSARPARLSGSISMPVEIGLPVCGHLISNIPMRPS